MADIWLDQRISVSSCQGVGKRIPYGDTEVHWPMDD